MSAGNAIPEGSTVLVTGLTGYIATHIAKQIFRHGYNVRGTVRDTQQASWLKDDLFSSESATGRLELVQVPDLGAADAFNTAVRGVSAIVHVATITNFDPDPHNVIAPAVDGVNALLQAAAAEPSVTRFVFTSSAGAAVMPVPGVKASIGRDSWNDAAVEAAWAPAPYDASHGMMTYLASKVEAEKAVWRFAEEKKPNFTVNVISPFLTLGEMLHKSHTRGTAGWVTKLWDGDTSIALSSPSCMPSSHAPIFPVSMH